METTSQIRFNRQSKVTGFDRRSGRMTPLEVKVERRQNQTDKDFREFALRALYNKMGPDRELINLVGIQFWSESGFKYWNHESNQPFCGEITQDELIGAYASWG